MHSAILWYHMQLCSISPLFDIYVNSAHDLYAIAYDCLWHMCEWLITAHDNYANSAHAIKGQAVFG